MVPPHTHKKPKDSSTDSARINLRDRWTRNTDQQKIWKDLKILSNTGKPSISTQRQQDTITLTCSIDDTHPVQLTWQRKNMDGRFVSLDKNSSYSFNKNKLIFRLHQTSYGMYRCIAKNRGLVTTKEFSVRKFNCIETKTSVIRKWQGLWCSTCQD